MKEIALALGLDISLGTDTKLSDMLAIIMCSLYPGYQMQTLRFCTRAILMTVMLVTILPFVLASCDNSTNATIASPTCAKSTTGNALENLNLSSAATVLAAGLLVGFNPCLLAILAFLASSVLSSMGNRKDIFAMIAAFSLGMFIVYIIFGVGLFSILKDKSTTAIFRLVLAAIILVLGVMQLEDARRLQSGGTSLFRTDWTKKYVHDVTAGRKLSSYFLLGVLFSLVRAPCVGGMYVAIIGIISRQGYASSGLLIF